jgi:hypothetical protein
MTGLDESAKPFEFANVPQGFAEAAAERAEAAADRKRIWEAM